VLVGLLDRCPFPGAAVVLEEVAFPSLAQMVTADLSPKVVIPSVLPMQGLLTQFNKNEMGSQKPAV